MEKTNAPGAGILKVIGIVGLVLSGISGLMMSIFPGDGVVFISYFLNPVSPKIQ